MRTGRIVRPGCAGRAPTAVSACREGSSGGSAFRHAAEDEAAASAEYGAEFRRDVEAFLTREGVEAVVAPGRRELLPVAGADYVAFCDPSGGSHDAMALTRCTSDVSRCQPGFVAAPRRCRHVTRAAAVGSE